MNALVVSVVPGDVGKPTVSSEKGILREGSCRWDYPVYETVKYIRDVKTGKINERIYHFVVSTVRNFTKNFYFYCANSYSLFAM